MKKEFVEAIETLVGEEYGDNLNEKEQDDAAKKFKNKMNIFLYNVKGKKEDRLRSYEGYFQSGKVKLVKGGWNEAFIAELTGYPDVPHVVS